MRVPGSEGFKRLAILLGAIGGLSAAGYVAKTTEEISAQEVVTMLGVGLLGFVILWSLTIAAAWVVEGFRRSHESKSPTDALAPETEKPPRLLVEEPHSRQVPPWRREFFQCLTLLIFAVALQGTIVLLDFGRESASGDDPLIAAAGILGAGFAYFAVPYLVGFIFPRNNRFSIRMSGVLMMALLAGYNSWSEKRARLQLQVTAHSVAEETREDALRQLEKKGSITPNIEKDKRAIERIRQSTRDLDPKSKRIADALLVLIDEFSQISQRYDQARKELVHLSVPAVTELHVPQDIAVRIEALTNYARCNLEMLHWLESAEPRSRLQLEGIGLDPGEVKVGVESFLKSSNVAGFLPLRRQDAVVTSNYLAMFVFLEAKHGKWRLTDGRVIFDLDADAEFFNQVVAEANAAFQVGQDLQRKAVDRR